MNPWGLIIIGIGVILIIVGFHGSQHNLVSAFGGKGKTSTTASTTTSTSGGSTTATGSGGAYSVTQAQAIQFAESNGLSASQAAQVVGASG